MGLAQVNFVTMHKAEALNKLIEVQLTEDGAMCLNLLNKRAKEVCKDLNPQVYKKGSTWVTTGDVLFEFTLQRGFSCFERFCTVQD
jgi:hypothetical protein